VVYNSRLGGNYGAKHKLILFPLKFDSNKMIEHLFEQISNLLVVGVCVDSVLVCVVGQTPNDLYLFTIFKIITVSKA
jgi:hypothetical protein